MCRTGLKSPICVPLQGSTPSAFLSKRGASAGVSPARRRGTAGGRARNHRLLCCCMPPVRCRSPTRHGQLVRERSRRERVDPFNRSAADHGRSSAAMPRAGGVDERASTSCQRCVEPPANTGAIEVLGAGLAESRGANVPAPVSASASSRSRDSRRPSLGGRSRPDVPRARSRRVAAPVPERPAGPALHLPGRVSDDTVGVAPRRVVLEERDTSDLGELAPEGRRRSPAAMAEADDMQ